MPEDVVELSPAFATGSGSNSTARWRKRRGDRPTRCVTRCVFTENGRCCLHSVFPSPTELSSQVYSFQPDRKRQTNVNHLFKITLVAMDIGVGFVVWGCMETLTLSHDARGAVSFKVIHGAFVS